MGAAREGALPALVSRSDVRGDLHMHSRWSDGQAPIAHMVKAAERLGHEYIAITDHLSSPGTRGLSEDMLPEHWREIDEIAATSKIHILKGIEVDILADGSFAAPLACSFRALDPRVEIAYCIQSWSPAECA